MKIGIDISPTAHQATGIGRYARQLVLNLLEIDKQNDYLLYSFFGKNNDLFDGNSNASMRCSNFNARLTKSLFFFMQMVGSSPDFLTKEADIMHSTDPTFPCSKKRNNVVTVHDLIFMKFDEFYSWKWKKYMKSMVRYSAKNADLIITPSEFTKNDLTEILGISTNKIIVIPEGVESFFKPSTPFQIASMRQNYNLPGKYLLALGILEARKNLGRLLEAFAQLKKNNSIEHKLVLSGQKGWGHEDMLAKLSHLGIDDEVIVTGFIQEQDLPALYSGASAFVYPSLYEGFGLPPLEAMACATPVICSNSSSLPEIAGNAALLVDPYNVEEIKLAMYKVIEDKDLATNLSKKGSEQAAKFKWQETAKKTLEVYNKILK